MFNYLSGTSDRILLARLPCLNILLYLVDSVSLHLVMTCNCFLCDVLSLELFLHVPIIHLFISLNPRSFSNNGFFHSLDLYRNYLVGNSYLSECECDFVCTSYMVVRFWPLLGAMFSALILLALCCL